MRDLLIDLVLSVVAWGVSDVVNYYRAGREAASEASISAAFSGIIPAGLVFVGLFFFRLFLLTPPRLDTVSHEAQAALSNEAASLRRQLLDAQTPQVKLEFRQGDNRYIKNYEEADSPTKKEAGYISIENPSGKARSVEDVTVVLGGAIGSKDLHDLGNVRLRIEDQYPSPAISIHPGQKRFVRVVSTSVSEGSDPTLVFSHGGVDGKSGGVVRLSAQHCYTVKIHVNGKDMPLLSSLITFGIENGSLYIHKSE